MRRPARVANRRDGDIGDAAGSSIGTRGRQAGPPRRDQHLALVAGDVGVDSPRMSIAHQNVALAVHKARDEAKAILNQLETEGHPETGQSSALYLALVMMQKRLLAVDPPPPPIAKVIPELEQLASECDGTLAPIKPLIDEALRVARRP